MYIYIFIYAELVPPVQMKQLYEAAVLAKARELFSVSGGHHNDTWLTAGSNYYKVSKCKVVAGSFIA